MKKVPQRFGFHNKTKIEWFDNIDNYSLEDCLTFADFVSDEMKEVESIKNLKNENIKQVPNISRT